MKLASPLAHFLRDLTAEAGRERSFQADETLFRTGDRVQTLNVVTGGEAQLVRYVGAGQALVLQRATAGQLLAEASLFSPRYHCDAVAATPCVVIAFSAQAVREALRTNADALMFLTRYLASAVVDLRNHSALLGIRSARARLLAYLSLLANADGHAELDGPWTAVAQEIGLSHEVVYRSLADLERAGELRRKGRRIQLAGNGVAPS